jgi:TolA-binding protein
MKHGFFVFLLAAVLGSPASVIAQSSSQPAAQSSSVKDLLGRMWAKLRAATPRSPSQSSNVTVTAGLRGAEATESDLKPYWRGEREQAAERAALDKAQGLADAGNYAEAAKAFDAFVQDNPKSPLAANAVFGAALARAAMGDTARAKAGFEDFLKREPQHPLAKDAEQALAALK